MIAFCRFAPISAPLLLADETPNLVKLDTRDLKAVDSAVMEIDCAESDAGRKPHDRIAMNARHALNGTNARAFAERADDGALLVKRKDIHGANPWSRGSARERDSGKSPTDLIYNQNGQSSRGQIRGWRSGAGVLEHLGPAYSGSWGARIRTGIAAL